MPGWTEPAVLCTVLVRAPGIGKSPVLKHLMQPLYDREADYDRDYQADRDEWETKKTAWEAPKIRIAFGKKRCKLLVFSAQTEKALNHQIEQYARFIEENPEVNLDDLSFTLLVGRKRLKYLSKRELRLWLIFLRG